KDCAIFHQSNDRPNVHLEVRQIKYPLRSFGDLNFLIPSSRREGEHLQKFLVFFDNIDESITA
ncbi:uncharacterized protein LAESUDRAFT_652976, partial [Laetiporus sulphureus 93-53]